MNEKTKQTAHEAIINDDDALLMQYNFADLPVVFSMRDGNQIIQEKEPCYLCTAAVTDGEGKSLTWYDEGSIIVGHKVAPNYHKQPLNRAAGIRWAKWQASLPGEGVNFEPEFHSQAAFILRNNPQAIATDEFTWHTAVMKLAAQLKLKALGKDARHLPGFNHNFAPQSGGNAPPMLGAKQAEMGQQGPGMLHGDAARSSGGVRRAAATANVSAGNVLGGPAPV